MKYLVTVLHTVALTALFSISAQAVPVVWSLDGLTRSDGGTVSGSFTYDADTNIYSAINVTTMAGGGALPGETYTGFYPGANADGVILTRNQDAPDLTGQNNLDLAFVPALTNAGGTQAPVFAREELCTNTDCSTGVNSLTLTGDIVGTVATSPATATSVPTMPAWLIGVMILAMAAFATSKLRKTT